MTPGIIMSINIAENEKVASGTGPNICDVWLNEIEVYGIDCCTKVLGKKLLFFKLEFSKLGHNENVRGFFLSGRSLKQLRQYNPGMAHWVRKFHEKSANDSNLPRKDWNLCLEEPMFELHSIHGMTVLMAYPGDAEKPLNYALQALVRMHQDKEWLAITTHPDYWKVESPENFEIQQGEGLQWELTVRENIDDVSFIGISQIQNKLRIELPSISNWECAGLKWLWHFYPCCESNLNGNITPWAGRVCNCPRPY
jgi:hypothetical protein